MSTDSGTLYVIDRYFRYIYALKRTRGCNGQFNWVLECVTIWRGQCPYGPGLHFQGDRELNCSEKTKYDLQHLHREMAVNYHINYG